jgi:hypothetical protein
MEILLNKIFLLMFFVSLIFMIYYIIRLVHLLISLKNETITQNSLVDIKNDLFESTKLKILWFSLSYILFYIFM